MEVSTERIAVMKCSRLELAQMLAADELPEAVKEKMRTWLVSESAEIVDSIVNVKALGPGNGHPAQVDLPATRKAMRKYRLSTKRGKKITRRPLKAARREELCKYCARPFKYHGYLVQHEAR